MGTPQVADKWARASSGCHWSSWGRRVDVLWETCVTASVMPHKVVWRGAGTGGHKPGGLPGGELEKPCCLSVPAKFTCWALWREIAESIKDSPPKCEDLSWISRADIIFFKKWLARWPSGSKHLLSCLRVLGLIPGYHTVEGENKIVLGFLHAHYDTCTPSPVSLTHILKYM